MRSGGERRSWLTKTRNGGNTRGGSRVVWVAHFTLSQRLGLSGVEVVGDESCHWSGPMLMMACNEEGFHVHDSGRVFLLYGDAGGGEDTD